MPAMAKIEATICRGGERQRRGCVVITERWMDYIKMPKPFTAGTHDLH